MTRLRVSFAWLCLLSVAFACSRPSASAIRSPIRRSISCATPPWSPTSGSSCMSTFARARLAALEQARSDPKTTDRGQATHDRLQDFLDVYDELNDNIDTYVERKADLRKVLKTVIDGDTEFQAKLRALRDDATAKKEETAAIRIPALQRARYPGQQRAGPPPAVDRTGRSCQAQEAGEALIAWFALSIPALRLRSFVVLI